jgi:diamine N-acetyltransferase
MHITIRRATTADAAMLAMHGARMFAETFAADNRPEDMTAYLALSFGPAIQAREIADPAKTFLVAESAEAVVGYAVVSESERPPMVHEPSAVELVRFYIDAPFHGTGAARVLMRAVDDEARRRGARAVWLDVWERNPRAIRFYEKCGFRDVGAQRFLLGDDVQRDRVMLRELPPVTDKA